MSVLARSVGNAFRNKVRTGAVVAVLAVAIGLALSMLVANQAVAAKVAELNASVGTVLTVNPAGGQGFEGGGEPLTAAQAATAAAVPNVTSVVGTQALRLSNATEAATGQGGQGGQGGGQGGPGGQTTSTLTTSLTSAVDAGTLGNRNQDSSATGTTGTTQPARSVPITATGIGAEVDTTGKALEITEGSGLGDYTAASTSAILGTALAEKNGLTVGSTFTINDQTLHGSGSLRLPAPRSATTPSTSRFPPAQTLAGLPDELSTMIVTVNSMENVDAAKTALQAALGADKADVTQGQRNLETAVSSLDSVKNISLIAFVAALGTAGAHHPAHHGHAGPRAPSGDRRPEGNRRPQPDHRAAVRPRVPGAGRNGQRGRRRRRVLRQWRYRLRPGEYQYNVDTATGRAPGQRGGGGGAAFGGANQLLTSVTASASPGVIAAGIAAVFGVAIIGSLVPALLTARIRPIEVLRGE